MNLSDQEVKKIGDEIVVALKTIFDPEIPVDIYELGLIYDVQVSDAGQAKVLMTLTTPNCPVAESLPKEVELKVKGVEGVEGAEVELTFEPTWEKSMMSEEALFELGML
jgi:FeS assembly SUF system protein